MSTTYDRRLVPARPDLAASHLRGQMEAARFVDGTPRTVAVPSVPLRREPHPGHGIDTELLLGETFTVYEDDAEGWSWGQAARDGYVGWLPSAALGPAASEPPTHRVGTMRTFVYPEASMKRPVSEALPFGAMLAVRRIEGPFAATPLGFVWAAHLEPIDRSAADHVAVAERFIGVPYLWGGKTSLGLDCSGLVQTALQAAGRSCPRDTDMQEAALGRPIDPDGPLQRGDLVFWKGHVGLLQDAATLLHANGTTMTVVSEPFAPACARILASSGGDVTSVRRLDPA